MRTGGCTVQQALTSEAANVVKQAVTLAKRRGHAQVTPLHVAHTMLSSPTGLLRTACLKSHSHALQCKALELCFNVALNRLPASTSSNPMLGPQCLSHPIISNALVAAFKRAQAHQRRGSIENQQQPLLAVRIEIEQLIISILDDPSVSRVMREAGFSSTQVKINVEKAVSSERSSQTPPPNNNPKESNTLVLPQSSPDFRSLGEKGGRQKASDEIRNEDVMRVIENMMKKKRGTNTVVVGECVATIEGIIGGLMDKVDKGEVPEGFREVKFISLPLFSMGHLSREEIEGKLLELRCLVKRHVDKGVVLYLGDLKWVTEYYCHVEHLMMEIGKLGCGIGENGRFWMMGIASFQTYMKCTTGNPSLESLCGLHPITIPDGTLSLALTPSPESDVESGYRSMKDGNDKPSLRSSTCTSQAMSSSLPSWLQKYKDENKSLNNTYQGCAGTGDHCEKPYLCERTITFSSESPSCSTSNFTYNHQYWSETNYTNYESLRTYNSPKHNDQKQALSSNPSSTPNSSLSSDLMEIEYVQRFMELNGENFRIICDSLEKQVPWKKDIIPEIASTVLQCRSGMGKIKGNTRNNVAKEDTWMFFEGVDVDAKEYIAKELARLVFGSHSNFVSVALSSYSCTRADSTEDLRNKRLRDEQSCSYLDRFFEVVSLNPHRVFFVEDIEQTDYCSQLGIKRSIESGIIRDSTGKEASLRDAIVILSCENFNSRSRACSPPIKQKSDNFSTCVLLDLNISLEGPESVENGSKNDIGLLECVDRRIDFKAYKLYKERNFSQ